MTLYCIKDDGRYGRPDKISFSPKLSNKRIIGLGLCLIGHNVTIQLVDEFQIPDGVGEDEGWRMVEVEEAFEIDIEPVLVSYDFSEGEVLRS